MEDAGDGGGIGKPALAVELAFSPLSKLTQNPDNLRRTIRRLLVVKDQLQDPNMTAIVATDLVAGGELPEGVLGFSEPERNRMVLPIDEAPDQLYSLITHELTHIFEFDIIPRGIVSSGLPLWVDEGLSDYMTQYWNPLDLMDVRDTALSDNVPRMSRVMFA